MKTLREFRVALFASGEELKSLMDSLPVTAISLVIWLALFFVTIGRDVLTAIATMLESGKRWAR